MNKRINLLIFCLFTFFLFNLNCYALNDYVIDKYDIDIIVNENNTLNIKETIKVNFNQYRHGIYRTIPLVNDVVRENGSREKNRVVISNVKVNEDFSKSKEANSLKIQIGDADRTVIGEKEYVISYDYFLGNDKNKNLDELYFNLIGTSWETTISDISFRIKMPKDFDTSKVGFTHGRYLNSNTDNIDYSVNNNVINGRYIGSLNNQEALTIRLELPEGYFTKDTWQNHILEMLLYLVPVGFIFITYSLWLKYGKDDDVVETVEFYAPDGFNSLDVAYAYNNSVNSNDVVSLLVYLANKGYVRIDEGKKKNDFTLTKLRDYDGVNKEERLFLEGLFKGNKLTVSKKDLEEKFYATISSIIFSKTSHKNKEKMFEKESSRKRWAIFLFMFITLAFSTIFPLIKYRIFDEIFLILFIEFIISIFLVIFGFIADATAGKGGLIGSLSLGIFTLIMGNIVILSIMDYSLIISDVVYFSGFIICLVTTLILYFFYLIITKRTKYGNEILGKIKGFKNFLETAEKDRLEALVNDNPNYFYDILPFTYVLGVSNKWIKKFESIAVAPPTWYGTDNGVFDYYVFSKSLNSTIKTVNRTLTSMPQSSGSGSGGFSGGGFSGGGFSGGGSGGGGGGSW